MPADTYKWWRRAGRWAPVPGGLAGLTAFISYTSLWRAVLVTIFPVIFTVVGYGAWSVLDNGSDASARGLLRVVAGGLGWFWTAIGLIRLSALWPWMLMILAGAAVGVAATLQVARRRRKKMSWHMCEMTSWSNADMASVVHLASDEQLCRIWLLTSDKLLTARFPSTVETIAEIRRLTLDELAERNPEGIARWLADRPETTDPQMYLRR